MASSERDKENKKKLAVLRKCTVELSRGMNPEAMMTALYAANMLTKTELEELQMPQTTRNKNLTILLKVPTKGLDGFDHFVSALQSTSEENPSHLELVELLMDTLYSS